MTEQANRFKLQQTELNNEILNLKRMLQAAENNAKSLRETVARWVVLTAFACGLILGVLLMMPRWWKSRRSSQRRASSTQATVSEQPSTQHHGI